MTEYKHRLQELKELPRRAPPLAKIDLARTDYPVIRNIAARLGWKVFNKRVDRKEEITLFWKDDYVDRQQVKKLLPYQRINHFPDSQELGNKIHLARHLLRSKSENPTEYSFFPSTWTLPQDMATLKSHKLKQPNSFLIVKPANQSQGRGIFITDALSQLENRTCLVQEYMSNPMLLDGLKFDIRIYVLLRSVEPLRVYLYQEGLVRLATKLYSKPTRENMTDLNMHLTNYAINRLSPQFIYNNSIHNDGVGHKRSLSSLLRDFQDKGHDVEQLSCKIEDIIVRTLLSVQPVLSSSYTSLTKGRPDLCFQLLGFDIILNDKLQPFLLEINHAPSFCTDTPLDYEIKRLLIQDTFLLVDSKVSQYKSFVQKRPDCRHEVRFPFEEPKDLGGFKRIFPSQKRQWHKSKKPFISPFQPRGYNFKKIKCKETTQKHESLDDHMSTIETCVVANKARVPKIQELIKNIDTGVELWSLGKRELFERVGERHSATRERGCPNEPRRTKKVSIPWPQKYNLDDYQLVGQGINGSRGHGVHSVHK